MTELPNPSPHITKMSQLLTHQADVLRKVVRSCYKHHGQEDRLDKPKKDVKDTVIKNNNSNMPAIGSCPPGPVPTSGPIQAKGWRNICPERAALPEAEASVFNKLDASSEKPLIEIYMCFYCEREFESRNKLQQHQNLCAKNSAKVRRRPLPALRRLRLPSNRGYKCREIHPDSHRRQDVRNFVESLGLVQKSKLATLQKRRTREVKVDEIEVDERPVPKTPTTPRSNKSLISQLSRDLSPPPSATKLLSPKIKVDDSETLCEIKEQKEEANADDAESVCSNKSDTLESEFNPRRLTSLLAIDLCSPLGQRVKKHVDKLDNSENSEKSPYEEFCHTPAKNKGLDRLRNRPNMFPITFKKSKRLCPKQCHWYKFTKKDQKEFLRICATGLNKRARLLKRDLIPCKVVLSHMKEADIVYWTTPKKRSTILDIQSQHARLYQHHRPMYNAQLYAQHEFMRLGQRAQLPLRHFNPHQMLSQPQLHQHLQQQRPSYKAVLTSNPVRGQYPQQQQQRHPPGLSNLSVYHLPLTNPASQNRNFGKTLQPGVLFGPKSRRQVLVNNRIHHRPNILSKENGEAWRNGVRNASRRLSMDLPGKGGELTGDALRQLPSSVPNKRPDDDVISISSSEDDCVQVPASSSSSSSRLPPPPHTVAPPAKRPLAEDSNNNSSAKKRQRTSPAGTTNSQIILFRCHLCQAEITCSLGQTDFIQKHFAEQHSVNNIHLLEHVDSNNQKVVTIVEDNSPAQGGRGPASAPPPHATSGPNSKPVPRSGVNNGADVNRKNRPHPAHNNSNAPGVLRRGVGRSGDQGSHRPFDNRNSAMDISGPPEIIVLD